MARKKYQEDSEPTEMDMTPMIDIVFNLLIFFMVDHRPVAEGHLAELTLPIAHMAAEDKDDDLDDRLILNIDKDGRLLYRDVPRSSDEVGTILSEAKREVQPEAEGEGPVGL